MSSLRRISVILLLGLCLCSCLRIDEEIKIKNDGSALLTLHYSVPQKYSQLLNNMEVVLRNNSQQTKRLPQARYFDRRSCEKYIKRFRGVTLLSYRSYLFEERQHAFIKISFKDFAAAVKKGFFPSRTFKLNKKTGQAEYRIPLSLPEKMSPKLKTLLKESSVSLKVSIEGEYISSNAQAKHNTLKSTQWIFDKEQDRTLAKAPKELWFKFSAPQPKPKVIEEIKETEPIIEAEEKETPKKDVHFIDLTETSSKTVKETIAVKEKETPNQDTLFDDDEDDF